jgi:tRNA pseudouridine38-40 synthase
MSATRRLKVVVAYDGHAYCGFQRQGRGLTAIQDVLYEAIEAVTGAPPSRFAAAGRTDAGVHALGQVVAFDITGSLPAERVPQAFSSHLPADVSVVSATEVPLEFHPRYHATGKTYMYSFYGWGGRARHAMLERYALHAPGRLDLAAMDQAARLLEGRHDFSAFQDVGRPVENATRTMTHCRALTGTHCLPPLHGLEVGYIQVRAQGFLYHMVRVIAGTLLEVGRGRLDASDVARALAGRDRRAAGPTAPARGLCLVEVHYCADAGQTFVDTPRSVS